MKKGIGLAVIAALAAAIAAGTAQGGPKSAAKSQSISCKSTLKIAVRDAVDRRRGVPRSGAADLGEVRREDARTRRWA